MFEPLIWPPEEKVRIVEETYLPDMSVSLVARRHGISSSQIFACRRLMAEGVLTAVEVGIDLELRECTRIGRRRR